MPLSAAATSLAEVLDQMTGESAPEVTEQLPDRALRCYACGHRCLIKEGKRGICKVRFNQAGRLRVPLNYVARWPVIHGKETVLSCVARLGYVDLRHAWLRFCIAPIVKTG